MTLPFIAGLSRKFASVIAKNIWALGFEASPASVAGISASRFKSSAMKSQKYKAATTNTIAIAINGTDHRPLFAADLRDFAAIFGFSARPQLAQKAASLAEAAPHEAHN
jgi:hypothetical protein